MALKRKITKAEHAALAPLLQAEYKVEGEEFVLDASGFDDPGELKRAKDREVEARRVAEAKVATLETKLATITDTDARRAGDIATLETSWKAKLDAAVLEATTKLAKVNGFLQSTLVDSVASQLAADLGGDNATLLLPHIKGRLTADLTGDTPLTRVLDKDGKPSAFSVEDLKKEIAADTRFKAVVIASKGSGGGAAGTRPTNGGAGGQKKFSELNDQERTEMFKADPAAFTAASEAARLEVRDRPAVHRAF